VRGFAPGMSGANHNNVIRGMGIHNTGSIFRRLCGCRVHTGKVRSVHAVTGIKAGFLFRYISHVIIALCLDCVKVCEELGIGNRPDN
jgi:hypothetical protein